MTNYFSRRRRNKKALLLRLEGRWEEAISVYRGSLDGSSADVTTYRWLIKCHTALGEQAAAAQ